MLEGDLENGELEIGQIAAQFRTQQSVADVMQSIIGGCRDGLTRLDQQVADVFGTNQ